MEQTTGFAALGMACSLLVAGPALSQERKVSAFDPSAPAADPELAAEGKRLADRLWSGVLQRCGDTAYLQVEDNLVIELDRPSFTYVPMRLPEAAAESGYALRSVGLASAERWRWARIGAEPSEWSDWTFGETATVRDDNLTLDRGFTAVENVVLKFDLVKKDGAWSATKPISQLSYAVEPIALDTVTDSAPDRTCATLAAR